MKRAGFTLIEIMVVVGIIVVLLAVSVVSLSSGRSSARMREAARGVAQMTRYANALALLRQRPVVMSYSSVTDGNGQRSLRIDVRLSGESSAMAASSQPADPIYLKVNGKETTTASEEMASEDGGDNAGSSQDDKLAGEKAGLFFTRRVLDLDELAKEDYSRVFDDVAAELEMLGEDNMAVDEKQAAALRERAQGILNNREAAIRAWSSKLGEINGGEEKGKDDKPVEVEGEPQHVIFTTNGRCQPHRVTLRPVGENGKFSQDDGFVITISRSAKVAIGETEEER